VVPVAKTPSIISWPVICPEQALSLPYGERKPASAGFFVPALQAPAACQADSAEWNKLSAKNIREDHTSNDVNSCVRTASVAPLLHLDGARRAGNCPSMPELKCVWHELPQVARHPVRAGETSRNTSPKRRKQVPDSCLRGRRDRPGLQVPSGGRTAPVEMGHYRRRLLRRQGSTFASIPPSVGTNAASRTAG